MFLPSSTANPSSYLVEGGDGTQAKKVMKYGTLIVKLYAMVQTDQWVTRSHTRTPTLIQSVHEKDLKGKAVDSRVR